MPDAAQLSELATILPGSWNVRATNYPMWLSRDRTSPRFTYELRSENPLVLRDDVSYFTAAAVEKHIVGADKWTGDGFVWRGRGLLALLPSRWTVSGMNEAKTVIAVRFQKTLATPAGIDLLVREGVEVHELRSVVARGSERFGLTAEDFASLTWLDTTN
jgi:hypothetical protein